MNIRITFIVFNRSRFVGFLTGRRVDLWDVNSRLFLLWCAACGSRALSPFSGSGNERCGKHLFFIFFESTWCVNPSLLLFLITISFCRQRPLFFLIALHGKQGVLYCFSMWICRTFTALGRKFSFMKSLYLSTALDGSA